MDREHSRKFGELLRKLTDQGKTIFIVSHDLEFCAEYADRVGMMFDGKIEGIDEPSKFFAQNYFYTTECAKITRDFEKSDHSATGGGKRMLNAVIIFMVCISCIPYYFKYEKKKPQTRESVVLAVMIALTVASRMLFAFSPGFKPVSAMVIICGMAFGRESGFLCGSLSAVVSNFFFWTRTMDSISDACMGNGSDGSQEF